MSQKRIRPRVFVVDDERIVASTLATILLHSGFEATAFTEPLKALKAAQAQPPDLLLSDVAMPLLSGIDLAIKVQELCPNCKVLLFSGQSASEELLEAARADGYRFDLIYKPVHPKDLLRKIQEVTGDTPPLPSISELFAGL
jgi:DNA-binding NtrC family response regulator